jgi:hypothetical protein
MNFVLFLSVFIYGQEANPHRGQYDMPSYEECIESSKSIYETFKMDDTIHQVVVTCVAHREADSPPDERSAGTPG